ncbi:MAG: hypothetical protein ACYTGZ_21805 [Planctomycetota bacterium]
MAALPALAPLVATVAMLLFLAPPQPVAPPDPVAPALAPSERISLLHASDEWLLWLEADRIPSPRIINATRLQYRLQKVGSPETRLVLDLTTYHPPRHATVFDDGTLVLFTFGDHIYWLPPAKAAAKQLPKPLIVTNKGNREYKILNVYADGLVIQAKAISGTTPVYWLPMKKREPFWNGRVRLTGKKGVSLSSPPPFIRHGKKFCFGHQIVDLKSGKRTPVKTKVTNWILSFNGECAADFGHTIRIADGEKKKLPFWHPVFAFHDGLAYAFRPNRGPDPTKIVAFDPKTEKTKVVHTWKTPRISTSYGRPSQYHRVIYRHHRDRPNYVFWTKHGIHVWDGAAWTFKSWLDAIE